MNDFILFGLIVLRLAGFCALSFFAGYFLHKFVDFILDLWAIVK